MGFFNFFKKKGESPKIDDLDLPPAPPPMIEGSEEKGVSTHPFPDYGKIIERPKVPIEREKELFPKAEIPTFPSFKKEEELKPPIDFSSIPSPDKKETPKMEIKPEPPHEIKEKEEIKPKEEKAIKKSLYIKVKDFREIFSKISYIRANLKKSDEVFERLNELESKKDKEFENYHSIISDVQKNLLTVDKSLFKGEVK